jgi:hypothetical protein
MAMTEVAKLSGPFTHALWFIERGLSIFPLHTGIVGKSRNVCSCGRLRCEHPAKHPMNRLADRGFKNATINQGIVEHWMQSAPHANIGLATGAVIVLDVDPRHDGDASLRRVESEHGPLPLSWRVLSGGGGEHIYFKPPPGIEIPCTNSALAPGLDTRGTGGYVVAPPSVHISGKAYAWSVDHHPDEVALAPLPDWIAQALRKQPSALRATDWANKISETVSEGCRDSTGTRLAGYLLRRYVDPIVTHELLQSWNATHCIPPMTPEQVTKIVDSIAGRELKRREAARGTRR